MAAQQRDKKVRTKRTEHKDFYSWFFKDWMASGARARLSEPARSIYHDLLGLAFTEGGISRHKAELMTRLGTLPQYDMAMDEAMAEFEIDPNDPERLNHPRVVQEEANLAAHKGRSVKGGQASAEARRKARSED